MSKRTALEGLAGTVDEIAFTLPLQGRRELEADRVDLVRTIREYLLPRLRDPDAPVVAAIVGPTGAGKSVVLNSLAQDRVSPAGVLRPTTSVPVLWAHQAHAGRYWSEFIARVRERVGPSLEVVVGTDPLTTDLTIIDTPPFDLASDDGSFTAAGVLSLADLCVFVATPSRYADAASWSFLRRAGRRGVPILFVLNRLPDDNGAEVALDYARHLYEDGLLLEPEPSFLFTIGEQQVEARHGGLPAVAVAALRKELGELADPAFRHQLVDQTSMAAVRSLEERVRAIANATEAEAAAGRRLARAVAAAYEAELGTLRQALADGEYAWMAAAEIWDEVVTDFMGILTRHVGDAAQRAAAEWNGDPIGRTLLESEAGHGLWRHGHDAPANAQAVLQALLGDLEHLAAIRTPKGKLGKRKRERRAALIWQTVLEPAADPPRALRRAYRDTTAALLTDGRGLFERAFELVLDQDAARFRKLVDPAARMAVLPAVLFRQVQDLQSKAVDPDPDDVSGPVDAGSPLASGAETAVESDPEPADE